MTNLVVEIAKIAILATASAFINRFIATQNIANVKIAGIFLKTFKKLMK